MEIKQKNKDIYQAVARRLGLKTRWITLNNSDKVLSVSSENKVLIVAPNNPGYYPEVRRWNAALSGSKMLSQKILKQLGYTIIPSQEIIVDQYASKKDYKEALTNAKIVFPALIKPDRGFRGKGIVIVENFQQLYTAAQKLYQTKKNFLIQPIIDKLEYRILVVNNSVMLVHSKHNPAVVGDGKTSITKLLSAIPEVKKDRNFIAWQHAKHQTKPSTILEKGVRFEYHLTKKPTTDVYMTDHIPKAIQTWARTLSSAIAAPVVGIDVFVPNEDTDTSKYQIIELNSNPGVDYLGPYCQDYETPKRIFEKVLRDHFKLT